AAFLFGLAPALHITRGPLFDALKESQRIGSNRTQSIVLAALVVVQLAFALVLLTGASLMTQTLWNLHRIDLGFRTNHLLTMMVPLSKQRYDSDEKLRNFYRETERQLKGLPGVRLTGFSSNLPFTSVGNTNSYSLEGEVLRPGEYRDALYREVSHDYLQTIEARLKNGRFFTDADRSTTLPVVVINEFMAKTHWPGQNPIGKRIQLGGEEQWRSVVGVIQDIRERGLFLNMKPAIYVPIEQVSDPAASYLAINTEVEPGVLEISVRKMIQSLDPDQPIASVRTMADLVQMNTADRNREMVLLLVFASLSLVLSCIGVYGVLAYAVRQQTREIGIRIALGAQPAAVIRKVVGYGTKLSSLGLAIGITLALIFCRVLTSLLYGVQPTAPAIYMSTSLILLIVAFIASYIPARRASKIDPIVALRQE
ncbi:MAG: hypothetical protein C5B54_05690, partial [Acidobacteria bacterium]